MVWNWQVEGGLIIYTGFRYSFNLVPRKGAGRWETLGTRSILWISWLKKGQACHNFLTCVLIRSKYFPPGDWLINRASGYTWMSVSSEWLIICSQADRSTTAGCFGLSTSNNDPPATTITHNYGFFMIFRRWTKTKYCLLCFMEQIKEPKPHFTIIKHKGSLTTLEKWIKYTPNQSKFAQSLIYNQTDIF